MQNWLLSLLVIYSGARLGGIGIGLPVALASLSWTLIFQIKPGAIPFDVIEIIMAVIAAIAAMQVAGGMDYLVSLGLNGFSRRHPKYITFPCPAGDLAWRPCSLAPAMSLLHAAGDHRSCQGARHSSVSSTVDCGAAPDSDHRLAHFRRSGLLSLVSLNRWALAI